MSEGTYSNIRDILGKFVGRVVIDITQHDEDEFAEDGRAYIMLMFDNGDFVKFFVGDDGFSYSEDALEG